MRDCAVFGNARRTSPSAAAAAPAGDPLSGRQSARRRCAARSPRGPARRPRRTTSARPSWECASRVGPGRFESVPCTPGWPPRRPDTPGNPPRCTARLVLLRQKLQELRRQVGCSWRPHHAKGERPGRRGRCSDARSGINARERKRRAGRRRTIRLVPSDTPVCRDARSPQFRVGLIDDAVVGDDPLAVERAKTVANGRQTIPFRRRSALDCREARQALPSRCDRCAVTQFPVAKVRYETDPPSARFGA